MLDYYLFVDVKGVTVTEEEIIAIFPIGTRVLHQVPALGIYTHGQVISINSRVLRIKPDMIDEHIIDVDLAVLNDPITRNSVVVPSPIAGIWQGYRGEQSDEP